MKKASQNSSTAVANETQKVDTSKNKTVVENKTIEIPKVVVPAP